MQMYDNMFWSATKYMQMEALMSTEHTSTGQFVFAEKPELFLSDVHLTSDLFTCT